MTVSSTTDRATFPGNGVAQIFPLPFRFFANSDIQVWLVTNATGVLTPQTIGVHYTLTGANDPEVDGSPTSSLTMLTAPTALESLFVQRVVPLTQPTDLINQGRFFPETHETVFDRLTMLLQQAVGESKGAIRVAVGDPEPARLPNAVSRALLLLGFDSAGNPIAVAPVSGDAADLALSLANSSDPVKGAGQIGYKGRTQYSRNQDQPHIFDFIPSGQHAAIVAGTSLYDAASDFAAAIAQAGEGGNIWLPQRGTILTGPVVVDVFGIGLRGANASAGHYSSRIKGITDGSPVFTVTEPQFSMVGVALEGLSDTIEKGEDITQDGVLLTAPTQNNNLDAVFLDCAFTYLRECIDLRGRNVRAQNVLFSNSRHAALIGNYSLADVRGLELYDCRFHSMGKVGTGHACVHAEPAANFSEIQVIGGEADDCLGMFTGFASNTTFNIHQSKARGQGYSVDATAATSSLARRSFVIRGSYQGEASAAGAFGAVKATGAMQLDVDIAVMGCTGHGLEINTPDAKVAGSVADAGQSTNNTYDAVLLGASAATGFIGNLKIAQDRYGVKANKARYGLNNLAADVEFGPVSIQGTFGTAQTSRDTARFFTGPTPGRPVRQAEVWGTAPPAGAFAQGAICHNTAPTRVKNISHWAVIVGGASPTWMAHGTGDGTTAERPTLGANDRGYSYWDTTVGGMIYWNGSGWLV